MEFTVSDLVQSMLDAPGKFVDVAGHDPLSAVILVFGGLIMLSAFGTFGYLTLGAIASLFTIEGNQPPQHAR